MANKDKILNATVKKDNRKIQVYKTESGNYNIFLGDSISVSKIEQKAHMETFQPDELKFN